ncbi:hypothetical protein SDC9_166241 [bioreactor metagenome]|uniref:Uncharacterized protein n=1 Tax=bioreactor metagenome TaxID=1076179 RepID=A0A645FYA3_9ZZZZ
MSNKQATLLTAAGHAKRDKHGFSALKEAPKAAAQCLALYRPQTWPMSDGLSRAWAERSYLLAFANLHYNTMQIGYCQA